MMYGKSKKLLQHQALAWRLENHIAWLCQLVVLFFESADFSIEPHNVYKEASEDC